MESIIAHRIAEIIQDCNLCDGKECMQKLLSKPFYNKKNIKNDDKKIGELTKQYIEENREILNQQIEEIKTKRKKHDTS